MQDEMLNTPRTEEDQDEPEGNDTTPVPEEIAIRREIVEFMNDTLEAALAESGGVYLSIPSMCKAIGLASQPQVKRIKNSPSLLKGLRIIATKTRGGPQRINFLRVDKIALWLAGVETAKMRRDTEAQRFMREKIEQYQEDLAPIATQVFLRVLNEGAHPSALVPAVQTEHPLLRTMLQQLQDIAGTVPTIHQGVIDLLRASDTQTSKLEHLLEIVGDQSLNVESLLEITNSQKITLQEAVELLGRYLQTQSDLEEKLERVDGRTKRLSPAHALEVQNAVGYIIRLIRKKNASITDQLAHRMIYGRLKTHFRPVTSYKEIDDDRFEEVMDFLRQEYRTILEEGPRQDRLF